LRPGDPLIILDVQRDFAPAVPGVIVAALFAASRK
jgi:hypothetical protein